MMELRITDSDLDKLEKYLLELLTRFSENHGYSNVQITFSEGKWGFFDNGEFNAIGTLHDLEKWLRNDHCKECAKKQSLRQYDIKHHIRDKDGHLAHPEDWNEIWLKSVAEEEGVLELTEEHMSIINSLRTYFIRHGIPPMIRITHHKTGFDLKKIYKLFPNGPSSAGKIAGIPRAKGHD